MNIFTIDLVRGGKTPLYQQLYNYIVSEIMSGRLNSNEKLPSKKGIAKHLNISTNTVETSYNLLLQEGYIYSKPRSGFYVSKIEDLNTPNTVSYTPARYKYDNDASEYAYNFHTNTVDAHSFPYKTWAKLSRDTLYNGSNLLEIGDTRGDFVLREALAKYLHEYRGLNCSPDQVIIGAGVEYLLTQLTQLLASTYSYAVENPGYKRTAVVLRNNGCEISYIPVDDDGIIPDALSESEAEVCYITPSSHFPTGSIMPIGRRYQILNWAYESKSRYIIEDDYNSEFTFSGKAIPSMQGIDKIEKVIYMSTFSRTLAPSIRIAYMVLPPKLSRLYELHFHGYSSTVSRFEQHTLAEFISGGYLGRHLNRVKNIYKKRRDFLINKLKPFDVQVSGAQSGLHLLVTIDATMADKIIQRAKENNIRLNRLSNYYNNDIDGKSTLLLGFAGMDEENLGKGVDILFSGL